MNSRHADTAPCASVSSRHPRDAPAVREDGLANIVSAWVWLSVEAARRGMKTEALRRWSKANGVPIRERNHCDVWVRPEAIDPAIERMPLAAGMDLDLDHELDGSE